VQDRGPERVRRKYPEGKAKGLVEGVGNQTEGKVSEGPWRSTHSNAKKRHKKKKKTKKRTKRASNKDARKSKHTKCTKKNGKKGLRGIWKASSNEIGRRTLKRDDKALVKPGQKMHKKNQTSGGKVTPVRGKRHPKKPT